jgi:hypothetical protein
MQPEEFPNLYLFKANIALLVPECICVTFTYALYFLIDQFFLLPLSFCFPAASLMF